MKSISELTDYYYNTLFPLLQKLETERKAIKKRFTTTAILYVVVVTFITLLIFKAITAEFLIVTLILLLAGLAWIYNYMIGNYPNKFKQQIIAPLIKEIDENLSYYPKKHIPAAYFNRSKLFSKKADKISGNDYVRGKIDDIPLEFSDLYAEYNAQDSDDDESEALFMGIFIVSEFPKKFQGETLILPDSAQKIFGDLVGTWLQSNKSSQHELIKMDSPDFEKEFVVYGTDQIEARYILTHTLMQRLLNYKKKTKHPIYVSFIGGKIYMAIAYNNDMFEPSVFHSLLEYKIAMEYIKTLHLAVGIIEELKLNQKLWSKI